ncbi:hypothetical protein CROQUDRAFT_650391 [Cronartium quercuum f. sp. fusiforme G11]|uniref:Uncharacterized protein n=1 Tax=Cronartium quercuum f. sp. fusiforme G11 TaxID=708437 RepID=A0A9P6NWT8_9BASI|nr:hypothetical protein CROQUDRAFT_650391 [Cronartium quercuum f. sp. fusiforme G11]
MGHQPNIDPSLPSATASTTAPPGTPPGPPAPSAASLLPLGFDHLPLSNSLAPLLHPRPPAPLSYAAGDDPSAHRPSSSKRARRRASIEFHGSDGDTSDTETDSPDDEYQDNQPSSNVTGSRPENEDENGVGSKTTRASTGTDERSKKKHKSSKRTRHSFRASNGPDLRASVDPLHLAHALALIQQQQPNPFYAPGSSSILAGLGVSTPSHNGSNAPAGSHPGGGGSSQQQSLSDYEILSRIEAATNPLRAQILNLQSQVEALDHQRIATAREMTSLRDALNVVTRKLDSLTGTETQPIEDRVIAFDPQISRITGAPTPPAASPHINALDIPVLAPSTPLQNVFGDRRLPRLSAAIGNSRLDDERASLRSLLTHDLAATGPSTAAGILSHSQPSRFENEEPFRRAGSAKKPDTPSVPSFTNPHSLINKTKKHRRPELSRTVRATVFRLMGISTSTPPATGPVPTTGVGHEPKFGNEKSRAYHGYTTSPCFPEYTNEDLIDPISKAKIWRWDWSRTIRQSPNNTAFAKEIRNVIVSEVEDTSKAMHSDVPLGDWEYLDDAIDSAYTNMRRERENQIDPSKMVKKEVHRARNKKRGLKEDKCKRRRKALDEYRSDPSAFGPKLRELGIELADRPLRVQKVGEEAVNSSWDECLDLRYMSSEDEHNARDFENPIAVGPDRPDSSLSLSDKIFAICRPDWRSSELQNLFVFLDAVKQPERAYRRVLGEPRHTHPPPGTPGWMIAPDRAPDPSTNQAN